MKLFDNYNRISLFFTVLIIIITGVVYYYTISYILNGQVDQDLVVEENEIFDYAKLNNKLPQVFKSEDLKITFTPAGNTPINREFSDLKIFNEREKERESARSLQSTVVVNGIRYRITIIESKVETEDLIRAIFLITLCITLVLIISLMAINRILIRNLWQPFYQMLKQITLFNLADKNTITGLETNIDEFKEMNREITAMSLRVRRDYQELKNFVENASHELMTPIAVINSKMDTLVQDGLITERQGVLVGEVYQTLTRMKRLNKSMLLLSRIESRLISEQHELNLRKMLGSTIAAFQELFTIKRISVTTDLKDAGIVMNRDLLEILLSNLLGNAVNHNHENGKITVSLQPGLLSVANTGNSTALETEIIFQRFNKSADSEGSGLGLTLIKEICELYSYKLTYRFHDGMHCFAVSF